MQIPKPSDVVNVYRTFSTTVEVTKIDSKLNSVIINLLNSRQRRQCTYVLRKCMNAAGQVFLEWNARVSLTKTSISVIVEPI